VKVALMPAGRLQQQHVPVVIVELCDMSCLAVFLLQAYFSLTELTELQFGCLSTGLLNEIST
jgi:hypothetical protein